MKLSKLSTHLQIISESITNEQQHSAMKKFQKKIDDVSMCHDRMRKYLMADELTELVQKLGGDKKVLKKIHDHLDGVEEELENLVSSVTKSTLKMQEQTKSPYAVGMAAAMKQMKDKPPLKKATIVRAHEIAKAIMKK
jgi:archaellum component FlaC